MPGYVVIIEDSASMAELERRYLEREGFSVKTASTGAQALRILEDGGTPDLLIVDYKLPDMSGVDLMQQVKALGMDLPVVVVTAAGNEQVAVSAMKLGAMDYIVKDVATIKQLPGTCREVIRRFELSQKKDHLMEELRRVNTELKAANVRLEDLSRKDDLTGIYNRRYFTERLGYEVARSGRYRTPLSMAFFDLDHFKVVNDTHGHGLGDQVLIQFAGVIRDRIRQTDVLARYGGEEFAVLLTDTPVDRARALADDLRELISRVEFGTPETPVRLTTSAGVAFLDEGMTRESLIETADRSLYQAKQAGRNRVAAVQVEPAGTDGGI
jgi:two-component system cell cycle response regulator